MYHFWAQTRRAHEVCMFPRNTPGCGGFVSLGPRVSLRRKLRAELHWISFMVTKDIDYVSRHCN